MGHETCYKKVISENTAQRVFSQIRNPLILRHLGGIPFRPASQLWFTLYTTDTSHLTHFLIQIPDGCPPPILELRSRSDILNVAEARRASAATHSFPQPFSSHWNVCAKQTRYDHGPKRSKGKYPVSFFRQGRRTERYPIH